MKFLALAVCLLSLATVALSAPSSYGGEILAQQQQELPRQQQQSQELPQQQQQQVYDQMVKQLRDEEDRRRVAEQLRRRFESPEDTKRSEAIVLLKPEKVLDVENSGYTTPVMTTRQPMVLVLRQPPIADSSSYQQQIGERFNPATGQQNEKEQYSTEQPEETTSTVALEQPEETTSTATVEQEEPETTTASYTTNIEKSFKTASITSKTIQAIKKVGLSSVAYASKITILRSSLINIVQPFVRKVESNYGSSGDNNSNQESTNTDSKNQEVRVSPMQEQPMTEAVKIVSYQVKQMKSTQVIRKQKINQDQNNN